ncbi:MAG: beta-propeller domain-containing protein [Prosthecobacter sp.]
MMPRPIALITAAFLLVSSLIQLTAAETAAVPLRFNVRSRVASVAVERGVEQIVLERKSGAGWKPLAVSYPRATGWGSVRVATFNLPSTIPATELRAQGYRGVKFPARLLKGKRAFDRKDLSGGGTMISGNGGPMIMNSVAGTVAVADSKGTTAAKAVESDIWQIVGDQVYFFNQYRGLQILDLSDPTLPVRVGSLRLPASGEQMFVLDDTGSTVALLGRSNDKARQGAATIWLIRVTDGVPALVGEVPLEGSITDSRLIGSTLHVLCSVWSTAVNTWTSEAVLTSIDLADIQAPQKLGNLRFQSYNAVLQASQGYLLIGTENYTNAQQRGLHVINVDAAPVLVKTFTPRGQIQDKFKMSIVNGAVVAVTLDWQNWSNRQTWVETFPLAGSDVAPLAAIELLSARNEQLHATRFDGDRLYVVTFRNTDPLFIVDLADPAVPVLSGELEVPGWSTYLEPLGNRLLAVGVEAGRVTVSLFDVADVTAPTLLSRLPLGAEGTHSWSEANYDEKAVEYLPDQGVVMVPCQTGSWGAGGGQKAIQIVNVGADALTAGATINHSFNPRRGSWIAGHFVTISGQELLVHGTDAASAAPEVTLSLAWRTDRVMPFGDFLVQIEDGSTGWYWGNFLRAYGTNGSANARLRITPSSDPDSLLNVIDLGAGRVVGISQKDSRLYLAQWVPATSTTLQSLRTLALELGSPPTVTEVGRVEHDLTGLSEYSMNLDALQPLWTEAQTLVWYIPMQTQRWWWGYDFISLPVLSVGTLPVLAVTNAQAAPPPVSTVPVVPQNPAAILCPISVTNTGISAGLAQTVSVKGSLRGTSGAFTEAGFIFFSYDTAVEQVTPTVKPTPTSSRMLATSTLKIAIPYAPYEWRVASWLQVVDWRSAAPVLRDPVSIPGQLLSVAQADAQGAVILTNSDQQISTGGSATRVIQASGYDGVSAWQLDNYITATPFYTASATDGTRVYLAREAGTKGVVGIGYNGTTGRLAQINTWTTTEVPSMLDVTSGHLLASSYGNLEVASIAAATGVMTPVASFDTPTNLWLQVNRAAFTPTLDLWIPAADYGVEYLQHATME